LAICPKERKVRSGWLRETAIDMRRRPDTAPRRETIPSDP
jgi:hypothetical protein